MSVELTLGATAVDTELWYEDASNNYLKLWLVTIMNSEANDCVYWKTADCTNNPTWCLVYYLLVSVQNGLLLATCHPPIHRAFIQASPSQLHPVPKSTSQLPQREYYNVPDDIPSLYELNDLFATVKHTYGETWRSNGTVVKELLLGSQYPRASSSSVTTTVKHTWILPWLPKTGPFSPFQTCKIK